jgi:diguanylate cyclase (GGDEF)-like protein
MSTPPERAWADAREMARLGVVAGDLPAAMRTLEQAMHAAQAGGDGLLAVALAEEASMMALRLGDTVHARQLAEAAEQWALALGHRRALGAARIARARVAYHASDEHDALAALEQAWPDVQAAGDAFHRIDCLTLLGAVLSDQDQREAATVWHQQALAEAQDLAAQRPGDRLAQRLLGRAWNNIAARYVNQALSCDDPAVARPLFERCVAAAEEGLRIHAALELKSAMAVCNGNRGLALGALGRFDEALAALDQADALRGHDRGNNDWLTGTVQRAQVLAMRADYAQALALLRPALEAAESRQALAVLCHAHHVAHEIAQAQGDLAAALTHFKRYHEARMALAFRGADARAQALGVRMQLEQVRAEREVLRRVAGEDALTGLANRRALDEAVPRLLARARELGSPLCVALIDLDHFKAINDRLSHAVGDAVLRHVGELLRGACRERDLAARYGGEEFAVLLADTDAVAARQVCERLRLAIEQADWAALSPDLRVTASIGVAPLADAPDTAGALAPADAALYAAKRAGRNRVMQALA